MVSRLRMQAVTTTLGSLPAAFRRCANAAMPGCGGWPPGWPGGTPDGHRRNRPGSCGCRGCLPLALTRGQFACRARLEPARGLHHDQCRFQPRQGFTQPNRKSPPARGRVRARVAARRRTADEEQAAIHAARTDAYEGRSPPRRGLKPRHAAPKKEAHPTSGWALCKSSSGRGRRWDPCGPRAPL